MKADASKEGMWEAKGCEELFIWSVDGQGCETPFADGGGVDNLAMHAALRRGTTKILSCYANGSALGIDKPLDPGKFWALAALFGNILGKWG
jgi:hypothetical protein